MSSRRRLPMLGLMIAAVALSVAAHAGEQSAVAASQDEQINPAATTSDEIQLPPRMSFLEEASGFLDTEQMTALTELMAKHRGEGMQGRQFQGQRFQGPRRGHHARGHRSQGRWNAMRQGRASILDRADELELSQDQIDQITKLQKENQAKMQELRQDAPRGQRRSPELRDQMSDLREKNRAAVQAVLTKEQQDKLQELRSTKREGRRAQRDAWREDRQSQRIDFLTKVLKLSDKQTQQVQKVVAKQQAKADELRQSFREKWQDSDERPTAEVRKDQREAVQKLMKEGRDDVRKVLNDQQKELFDALAALQPQQGAGGRWNADGPGGRGGMGRGKSGHRGMSRGEMGHRGCDRSGMGHRGQCPRS